jgi:hypothetical protein
MVAKEAKKTIRKPQRPEDAAKIALLVALILMGNV